MATTPIDKDFLKNKIEEYGISTGRSVVHSLFPNDYEYYLCSLELYDSQNKLLGLLSFVVMPNNLLINKTQIANLTKTNKSSFTVFNSSFVPKDISIQGSFGRKIRMVLGNKEIGDSNRDLVFGQLLEKASNITPTFVKSGYGLSKMLEKIIDASWSLDSNGLPCFLVFRNYSFNQSFIVEVMQNSFAQSMDSNMMWNYSLEMKAVAPASIMWKDSSNSQNNKAISRVLASSGANSLNKIISSVITKLIKI